MRTLLTFCCILSALTGLAQTKVDKSIATKQGQKLLLVTDYPDVTIQTWDKQEIMVQGTVSINNGENDNAFEVQVSEAAGTITVTTVLKDKENIPHRVVIKKGDREYFFKAKDINDPEIQKFLDQNGREYSYI